AEAEALLARAEAEAETAVKTARATMEEKRAFRDRAERDYERAQDLIAKQVITNAEHDRAEADAIAARYQFEGAQKDYELAEAGQDPASKAREADVRRAKARLDRVRDGIEKTRLVSPADGFVVRRMTEVGAWITPGVPVIEILTLDPVLVRFDVNERDIAKVKIGDPAVVRVDAHPGRDFAGKVRFIVPEAAVRSRSFPVLIEVPNPTTDLKSGMFARVELGVGEERKALTVSKDAIVRGPQGTVIFTFGKAEGQDLPVAKPIPVATGLSVGSRVVVTGPGLAPGMPVVTTGNEKLIPGQPVIPSGPPGGAHGGPPRGKPGGGGEKPPVEDGR
ncbi:MAG: efflux RND transporter periplasmic adaptor subunit, partial [Planctomycetota bacterium]